MNATGARISTCQTVDGFGPGPKVHPVSFSALLIHIDRSDATDWRAGPHRYSQDRCFYFLQPVRGVVQLDTHTPLSQADYAVADVR